MLTPTAPNSYNLMNPLNWDPFSFIMNIKSHRQKTLNIPEGHFISTQKYLHTF